MGTFKSYFKSAHKRFSDLPKWLRVIALLMLVIFLIILLVILIQALSLFSSKDWLSAFGTLVASFVGAWFAFSFAKYQREQERIRNEVVAGNLVLFTLTQMYSETRQYQKEIVAQYRGKPDAWLNLNIGPQLNKKLSFDVASISFVMEVNAPIFADVMLEEARFRHLATIIDSHRDLTLSQLWPRLEAAGLKIGESRPEEEIEKIVGPSCVRQLKVTTAGIIVACDENEKTLRHAFRNLRVTLKSIYPEKKFIDFIPLD